MPDHGAAAWPKTPTTPASASDNAASVAAYVLGAQNLLPPPPEEAIRKQTAPPFPPRLWTSRRGASCWDSLLSLPEPCTCRSGSCLVWSREVRRWSMTRGKKAPSRNLRAVSAAMTPHAIWEQGSGITRANQMADGAANTKTSSLQLARWRDDDFGACFGRGARGEARVSSNRIDRIDRIDRAKRRSCALPDSWQNSRTTLDSKATMWDSVRRRKGRGSRSSRILLNSFALAGRPADRFLCWGLAPLPCLAGWLAWKTGPGHGSIGRLHPSPLSDVRLGKAFGRI